MKQFTIPVIALMTDDQSGGFSMELFPTEDALIASAEENRCESLTDKEKKAILNGDDEYENGYISKGEIVVEIDEKGKAKLAKNFFCHGGQ